MNEDDYIQKRLDDQITWYDGKSQWNQKYFKRFQVIDNGLGDDMNIGDPTAADRNGDALARADLLAQIEPRELVVHFAGNIFHLRTLKRLPQAKHLRISGHGGLPR